MGLFDKIMYGTIFPLICCLIGYFVFARKGFIHLKTKKDRKRRCLSQTIGTIVHIGSMRVKRGSGGYGRCYFPEYEYVVNDEVISGKYKFGTSRCQYRIGEQVNIYYDAKNPKYSYIDGYKEDIVSVLGSVIGGSIVISMGLFIGLFIWFS